MPGENYLIAVGKDMIQVLEFFFSENTPLGITQLANALKMSKNKVFRIVYTWKEFGYIQKREYSEMYELGPKIFELTRNLMERNA
jgi:DNA-binding IclR family transcriptional regulator